MSGDKISKSYTYAKYAQNFLLSERKMISNGQKGDVFVRRTEFINTSDFLYLYIVELCHFMKKTAGYQTIL